MKNTKRYMLCAAVLVAGWFLPTTTRAADYAGPDALMRAYVQAMDEYIDGGETALPQAIECFDLSRHEGAVREEVGTRRAKELIEILDRTVAIRTLVLPAESADGVWRIRLGDIGVLLLTETQGLGWRISSKSVDDLPGYYRKAFDRPYLPGITRAPLDIDRAGWIRQYMPAFLRGEAMGVENWQWIALFVVILIGLVAGRVVAAVVSNRLRSLAQRGHLELPESLQTAKASRPFGLVVMAAVWLVGLSFLGLPLNLLRVLLLAGKVVLALGGVRSAYRLVDLVSGYLARYAATTDTKIDDLLVPMVRKSLKVFVSIFALLFIAQNLGVNVSSMLAGLGLGGLAFALASKDTVENLFGCATIMLDNPFRIGDWVVIGGTEGTVESVGFRSTRIRTFYNSVITVPNSCLVNSTVDNMGLRQHRRIKTMISITYGTAPETVSAFCEAIRELIRTHPFTRKDYYHVYFNQFNASSLDILLYCFITTDDWAIELRERQRLFLDIMRVARELGVEFAYPTQTLHMIPTETPPSPTPPTDILAAGQSAAHDIFTPFPANDRPGGVSF